MKKLLAPLAAALLIAACGGPRTAVREPSGEPTWTPAPSTRPAAPGSAKPATPPLKRGGGFYKDDGPADDIPEGLDDVPDAQPKWEPLNKATLKPYVVLGKEYVPNTSIKPYKARGIASWYGKKFHGQKTSIGEPYDMFAMTAAHPTLALPSYVRVTNVQSGKSVVVRVTDRGPFHANRIIDLSYTAAHKLGLIGGGSGLVDVEAIIPGAATGTAYAQVAPPPARPAAPGDDMEELAKRMAREEIPTAAAATTPAPAKSSEDKAAAKGVYLQLGAFSNAENAENLKSHLARDLDWVAEPMHIFTAGGIHRLQLGPYASRGDADRIAEKIRGALGYRPTFVTR